MEFREIEIHFFEFKDLNPNDNYGQVYIRLDGIDEFYNELQEKNIAIHHRQHSTVT